MRKNLLVGLVLAVAAMVVVFVSHWLDLELEPVALLGVAVGAVIAVVPDRSPFMRLAAFGGGVLLALIGYLVRAAVLPDSAGGRALAVGLIVALVASLAAVSRGRLALWATLLGAATFAGAYEYTYAAAPPLVASTSLSTLTSLVLTVAVGFLAAVVAAPVESAPEGARRSDLPQDDETHRLDDMMETK